MDLLDLCTNSAYDTPLACASEEEGEEGDGLRDYWRIIFLCYPCGSLTSCQTHRGRGRFLIINGCMSCKLHYFYETTKSLASA